MWKKYSLEFIRKNRASSLSIMTASLIASLFLSLLCSLFFNVWVYEVGTITMEEGGWQGRISGSLDRDAVSVIEAFANVDHVEINEALSGSQGQVAEVFFQNKRTIYQDMPQIAEKLGLGETAVSYHERLLSRYLIYDPQDSSPPLLPAFYLGILVLVCLSLVFIIHNSFAVSMNARIHQFGILSSIGAAPGQILACLLEEAAMLCAAPILLGCLAGTGLSFGTIKLLNALASGIPGRHPAVFSCHPLVFAITMASAVLTVFFSAWLPAWKLSRMTPLAAVHSSGEFRLTRKKHSPVLKALFGVEGQLAGNALKAQRHALRTSTLSLTFSFLGFTLMMCFFTLSDISTSHTYFQRYQDAWDVMVTVKGEEAAGDKLENEAEWEALHSLANARDCVIYQKAEAVCLVPEEAISEEITETGGLEMVLGKTDLEKIVMEDDGYYPVKAPVIILDDTSFQNYCRQLGIAPDGRGSIVRNCVWDRVNSNFRYKEFVPL
ncbi:MAG: ABC transporter permease, partial [Lachnospiraceae bacterium]|nr:ABC transporter permease [Lachnospiraceae bacterium]